MMTTHSVCRVTLMMTRPWLPPNDLTEFELYVHACMQEVRWDISISLVGTTVPAKSILLKTPDFELLCPHFGWISAKRVKQTIENTTQHSFTKQKDISQCDGTRSQDFPVPT
jgi:hypothetical protein